MMQALATRVRWTVGAIAVALTVLAVGLGDAIAQTADLPAPIHLRLQKLRLTSADGLGLVAAGFVVVRPVDPQIPLADGDRAVLLSSLQQALRRSIGSVPFDANADDLAAAVAALGEDLGRVSGELGLHMLSHGLSDLQPDPQSAELLAERLAAQIDRDRRRYEADVARITAEAAAAAARFTATADAEIAEISAQAAHEAVRIVASAAAAAPEIHTLWVMRRLAASHLAEDDNPDANPFSQMDALMAACLSPFVSASVPSGDAVPQALRPNVGKDVPHRRRKSSAEDDPPELSLTITALTADGLPADLPVSAIYRTSLQPRSPELDAALVLLGDIVGAELTLLMRATDLAAATHRSAALSDELLVRSQAAMATIRDDLQIVSIAAGPGIASARLGVTPFGPLQGEAMLDTAQADAREALEQAEAAARQRVAAAQTAGERRIAAARREAATFSAFLERFREQPELTARRFCLSLITGAEID